jgi:hypothetical protein
MKKVMLLVAISVTVFLGWYATPAEAQATRTWVSGVGDDVNPCSRTAPCKTFAGAISKTATGGEINCLDPGGFGGVTIGKSLTIDCEGTLGSILASATTGVLVNGAGIIVNLRNLTINGTGTTLGTRGVRFLAGSGLIMTNVNIMNFGTSPALGVEFTPSAANATLDMNRCVITGNGIAPTTGGGILVQPSAGGSAVVTIANTTVQNNSDGIKAISTSGAITMTVRESVSSNNRGSGITAQAGNTINLMSDRNTLNNNFQNGVSSSGAASTVRVYQNSISGNTTGAAVAGGGQIKSYKNNAINGNGTEGTPLPQENLE